MRPNPRWLCWAAAGCLTALCGCVEREILITSEPAGSMVQMSGKDMGVTPLTVPYVWHGDYEIILRHPESQTLKTHADINGRWYDLPPIDLLAEIAPWTFHDRRYLHFKLQPLSPSSDRELIERADAARQANLAEGD